MKFLILQNLGYESKHNTDCWKQNEYIGFGIAAHSYLNDMRYSNLTNIQEYIKNIKNEEFGKNVIVNEKQTIEGCKKEYMMLGLRRLDGVCIKDYKEKFGENPIIKYCEEIERLVKLGLLNVDGDFIKLTDKGLDFANQVWEEFV